MSPLSILTPTRNRPLLLRNGLRLLADRPTKHGVIVVDGSDPDIRPQNEAAVREVQSTIDVQYFVPEYLEDTQFTGKRGNLQMMEGAKQATCKYLMYVADDDFFLEEGVDALLDRALANPRAIYSGGVAIKVETYGIGRKADSDLKLSQFRTGYVDDADPIDRLVSQIRYSSTLLYGVFDRYAFSRAFDGLPDLDLPASFTETLVNAMMVLHGPTVRSDDLTIIRHVHDRSFAKMTRNEVSPTSPFHPDFASYFARFLTNIRAGLALRDLTVTHRDLRRIEHAFLYSFVARTEPSFGLNAEKASHEEAYERAAAYVKANYLTDSALRPIFDAISENQSVGLSSPRTGREGI